MSNCTTDVGRFRDHGLERLLSTKELVSSLGIRNQTARLWRLQGRGPRYLKLSSTAVRYRLSDVQAWLAERTFASTTEQSVADRQAVR
jgi:predicted DNA-binding transcriptional regulator AlpA